MVEYQNITMEEYQNITTVEYQNITTTEYQNITTVEYQNITLVEYIVMAREERPPYGVSSKGDRSNTRELIRSENMDRLSTYSQFYGRRHLQCIYHLKYLC
jgi:hypothetical protein